MIRDQRSVGQGRYRILATGVLLAVATTTGAVVTVTDEDGVPDDAIHAGVPDIDLAIDFNRDVRPILVARCFACHGPDSSTRERGLRLDVREGAVEPARTGRTPVVMPHDADGSLLLERITDPEDPMPPSGEPLTAAEIDILRRWIDGGAEYDGHWSWKPIVDPDSPKVEPRHEPLVRTEVDRFILDRLAAVDIEPADDATPARQVRRLAFDLTGLPPDPGTVEAFEADPSDERWDEIVEQYLASPAFGERWGRHWLDLVRYAETCGHEFDYPIREAWRYRDWVVRAFNRDVPYDRFIAEQIAGDLLDPRINPEDGTNESVIGTGQWYFHQAVHAPTDVTQDQSDRIANQLEVFGQGFLGLTVACARCHDHKFDAISTRDYYALSGYMQSMHQGYAYLDPHTRIDEAVRRIESAGPAEDPRGTLAKPERLSAYLIAASELRPQRTPDGKEWEPLDAAELETIAASEELDAVLLERWIETFKNDVWRAADHPWRAWVLLGHDGAMLEEKTRRQQQGQVIPHRDLEVDESSVVLERFDEPGTDLQWYPSGWAWTGSADTPSPRDGTMASDRLDPRLQGTLRSETFTLDHRFLHWRVRGTGAGVRIRLVVEGMVMDEFNALLFQGYRQDVPTYDGWRHVVNDTRLQSGARAHLELIDDGQGRLEVDAIWLSDRGDGRLPDAALPSWVETAQGEDPAMLAYAFDQATTSSTESATYREPLRDRLIDAGLWGDTLEEADANRDAVAVYERDRREMAGEIPDPVRVLAAQEGSGVDQNVYVRGSHRTPGETAVRSFITSIAGEPKSPDHEGSGRIELVNVMFDDSNPFPARVMANRVWHHLLGRGLVPTTDDFGGLGKMASHPELLDHLASRLRETWSIKDLVRSIVRSSSYRRSSEPVAATAERMMAVDPDRALLGATPIRRLEAEAIRDAMLATSGRLDSQLGGPPVATHLTPFMTGRGRPGQSGPLDGDGRRSIYLGIRRNFANPMMAAFDLPAPMTTVGRRNSSNVPAQSLVLMNDPFVHEMARLWSERILADESLVDDHARARRMWRQAFAETPRDEDLGAVVDFVAAAPESKQGWIDVAHAFYNAKAFIHLD